MKISRWLLLLLAALTALAPGGCAWTKGLLGEAPATENRNAELGSNLRPKSAESAPEKLGLDPRARDIEKNLGL